MRFASSFEEAMEGSRGAVSEQCTGKKETPPSNTNTWCRLVHQVVVVPVVKSASISVIVLELRLKAEILLFLEFYP